MATSVIFFQWTEYDKESTIRGYNHRLGTSVLPDSDDYLCMVHWQECAASVFRMNESIPGGCWEKDGSVR